MFFLSRKDLTNYEALPAGRHRPRTASFGQGKSSKDREITKWKFLFRSEKRTITIAASVYHIVETAVKLF